MRKNYQIYKGLSSRIIKSEEDRFIELLEKDGFFILNNVFNKEYLIKIRNELDRIWNNQIKVFGKNLLKKIGDWGQVRAIIPEHKIFIDLVMHSTILKWVDLLVGETSILHLQNGIILFPGLKHNQSKYHKDFPKDFVSTKLLSVNVLIVIKNFTKTNGGTYVIPGRYTYPELPSQEYISSNEKQITCPAGSLIVLDSNLWHGGGINLSKKPRRAINQQYTRPFIKQQIDYPSLFGSKFDLETMLAQRLGYWSIPPKSLEKFRVNNPSKRTYRAGQG